MVLVLFNEFEARNWINPVAGLTLCAPPIRVCIASIRLSALVLIPYLLRPIFCQRILSRIESISKGLYSFGLKIIVAPPFFISKEIKESSTKTTSSRFTPTKESLAS